MMIRRIIRPQCTCPTHIFSTISAGVGSTSDHFESVNRLQLSDWAVHVIWLEQHSDWLKYMSPIGLFIMTGNERLSVWTFCWMPGNGAVILLPDSSNSADLFCNYSFKLGTRLKRPLFYQYSRIVFDLSEADLAISLCLCSCPCPCPCVGLCYDIGLQSPLGSRIELAAQ